ncbi:MAG: lipocalin-like domain-containing protein [Acidobacteria bacterium]|nr:lipocalin-like domain-containing protein [Acidobacteriota bacterium]
MADSIRTQLIGTWRLRSYETVHANGSVDYPFGSGAVGLLVYTADGFMSGHVMRSGRPHLPSGYRGKRSAEEALDAFDGYIAYCGRYTVDESTNEVVHHVEASLYPNWVGGEQRRGVSFADGVLTLSASRAVKGGTVVHRLVWVRA